MAQKRKQPSYHCKLYAAGRCNFRRCPCLHVDAIGAGASERWVQMKTFIEPILITQKQPYRFIVIIDLEHVKGEIIEFPSLILDTATGCEIARFHRWVRPLAWDEKVEGKNNPASNAIPFSEALVDFEAYLRSSDILEDEFICLACGNWDIGTQVVKDCTRHEIEIPSYFNRWVNWKELALFFYDISKDLAHLEEMLNYLKLPMNKVSKKKISSNLQRTRMKRFHDVVSIARVVRKMMQDGAVMEWTGKRNEGKILYRLKKKNERKQDNGSRKSFKRQKQRVQPTRKGRKMGSPI